MAGKRGGSSKKLLHALDLDGIASTLRNVSLPGKALTWSRFCGALSLVLTVQLFISGAAMCLYYSPAPGTAYDSVDFAMFSLPFGSIVRGIHYYSWNLLLAVLGLHLARAFIIGAYKRPREPVWISGIIILLVIPLFIITGDLLPWDQKGYWSTQVRLSIISSVPVAGDFITRALRGSSMTGIVALTRFYVLHILFLPLLLSCLIAVHFHFLARRGIAPSLKNSNSEVSRVPFLPDMVNRWLFLFLITTVILAAISWYWPAPLGDPADPTDSSYVPKPEWWVLFLNQLVTIFKGPLMIVGSMIIPGGVIIAIIALPWIDRTPDRHPMRRKGVMIVGAIFIMLFFLLSIVGYMEHHGPLH